jgi:hypothetical protein
MGESFLSVVYQDGNCRSNDGDAAAGLLTSLPREARSHTSQMTGVHLGRVPKTLTG